MFLDAGSDSSMPVHFRPTAAFRLTCIAIFCTPVLIVYIILIVRDILDESTSVRELGVKVHDALDQYGRFIEKLPPSA
jgi:hypothetical protein